MAQQCQFTELWKGIFEREDEETAKALLPHLADCPACFHEVERLLEASPPRSAWKEWLDDFCVGLGFIGLLGIFFSARGVTDAINQAIHDSGGKTPPWFKPRKK